MKAFVFFKKVLINKKIKDVVVTNLKWSYNMELYLMDKKINFSTL